jgi:uncharacterized DUF497 family protein
MNIAWDEPKRLANLEKHGLDFADLDDIRGVVVVVFSRLGREGVSIMSMRPASRNERKLYAER